MAKSNQQPDVVNFDFVHPQHQLVEPIAGLAVFTNRLGVECSQGLQQTLRLQNQIDAEPIEYLTTSDYVSHLTASATRYQFELQPLIGAGFLKIEQQLINALVQQFFGGIGETMDESSDRQPSPTEVRLGRRVKEIVLTGLVQLVSAVQPVELFDSGELTTIALEEGAIGAGVYVVLPFKVKTSCGDGEFSIGLPYNILAPLGEKLLGQHSESVVEDSDWQHELQQRVVGCEVALQGVLAEAELSVDQLLRLQAGDFIPLGGSQTATFLTDGHPLFEALVGISNGKVSANLSHWFTADHADQTTTENS